MKNPQPANPGSEPAESASRLRRGVYLVLIALAAGNMLGRLLAVNSVDYLRLEQNLKSRGDANWQKQRPFLSANDRSRWATVRSLVEHGTYQIDEIVSQPNWDTIDIVKHDDEGNAAPAATEGHLYSSKPTLLPTLVAGEYWVIHKASGWTLGTHPYFIGRLILATVNILPMVIYFVLLAALAERIGTTDWGRIFVVAAGTLGTFLTTFSVVLNNHLPAAVVTVAATYLAYRIAVDEEPGGWRFALAGLCAAMAAACELPALAFFALVSVWLLYCAPRQTLLFYAPAALVVAAGAVGTNYLAHGTIVPAYAHREEGNNWYAFQYMRGTRVIESYWSRPENRSPIDRGEPDPAKYVLHSLVGHHGIFSLTPIWLLTLGGLVVLAMNENTRVRQLAWVIIVVSLACLVFYIGLRPQQDRNYGGMTSGFRWVFWLAPLWLVGMLPAADWLARRRWTQVAAAILLTVSVLSASYPTWNPWTHPWILDGLLSFDMVELGPPPAP